MILRFRYPAFLRYYFYVKYISRTYTGHFLSSFCSILCKFLKGRFIDERFPGFLSYKNHDDHGCRTRDGEIAKSVYSFLTDKGLKVFFSEISLEKIGKSCYSSAIDEALDSCQVLVVVGTSASNIKSRWVFYEWNSFLNDIRSEIKPDGEIFSYIDERIKIRDLPRPLRIHQVFHHNPPQSLIKLYGFIRSIVKNLKQATVLFANFRAPDTDTRKINNSLTSSLQ